MMSKQEGIRKFFRPYLWLTLMFVIIVGILLGRAGATPASAAASKAARLSSTMNYSYHLIADIKTEGDSSFVFFQTDGSGFLHAIQSTNQDLNQRIQADNDLPKGEITPETTLLSTNDLQSNIATVSLPVSQMAVGDTYYQLFDAHDRKISNRVEIRVREDGTAVVICDISQHNLSCDD